MKNGLKEGQMDMFKKMFQEIEDVVKDNNKATIKGNTYQLSQMTYREAIPFLEYWESVQANPLTGVPSKKMEYLVLEDMLSPYVLFEGAVLKNLPNHFNTHRKDYLPVLNTMLLVAIYDFLEDKLQPLKDL